jgi:trehalose 6-phosphate synthase/phosphatase
MKLIIISNRALVTIVKENDEYKYVDSPGGLASGLKTFVEKTRNKPSGLETVWVGWPGVAVEEKDRERVSRETREKYGVHCVFLSEELMDKFYLGFCNKTIWPLFHYFPLFAVYDKDFWEEYKTVNRLFCEAILEIYEPGDLIWIHDYHFMLLPSYIRSKLPESTIGFFLHIPFPSYEIFRLLPSAWRKEILQGLYGADLIGLHTYDYRTHFLQSTLRILGINNHMGEVMFNNRLIKVDSFPMGIDYSKYHDAANSRSVMSEKKKFMRVLGKNIRFILSIDRQDYSKGILNRMLGYELFLETHPEWIGKVLLMMVIVPSRIGVEHYQQTKSRIDELVGRINGKFGTVSWTPVIYQYRSMSFNELVALYTLSHVALVTPLRDGMNLIAKEYVASRVNKDGVLILSEMAGSADELAEGIIINPNNVEEISESLNTALLMRGDEQKQRIIEMQRRLNRYDILKWADDFLTSMEAVKRKQDRLEAKMLHEKEIGDIIAHFKSARFRLLFLDYDGTLVPFTDRPEKARPSRSVLNLLEKISLLRNTEIVIISGRDRETLEKWFGHLPLSMVAEHGIFLKEAHNKWEWMKPVRKNWKKKMLPVLKMFTDKLPGSFVEEKDYSIAFHYRKAEPQLADLRLKELMAYIMTFISNLDVQVLEGDMVLELRNAGVDKGVAAMHWLASRKPDFILAIGNDRTDEDLFRVLPVSAYSIKAGLDPSYAKLNVTNSDDVIALLTRLVS